MRHPHPIPAAVLFALALLVGGCAGESEEKLLASARSYAVAKDHKAATIQLKTLLQRNPQSAPGRFLLGRIFLEMGDAPAALVELNKAKELGAAADEVVPEIARAMLMAGEQAKLLAQLSDVKLADATAQADLLTSVAFAHALAGNLERSRAVARQAQQAQPTFAPASILLARLMAGANDLDGALRLLDEVLAREPANDRAGTLKAELQWRGRRDLPAALASFRKVLETAPRAVAAHVGVIGILTEQGQLAEAKKQFEALRKLAPNHPDTLHVEAQLALREGDANRSREIAARLLKAMPDNPRVLLLAAAAEYRLRAYAQAEGMASRALKLSPTLPGARQLLAQTHLRSNQPARALDALAPLLEGSPDGTTLALVGEAYMMLGDAPRADQAFQLAARASPGDTQVRTAVALAQYARGETAPAMTALEEIAADDKGPRADLALISARMRAKDSPGALKAVEALRKKMPDNPLPDLLRGRILALGRDAAGATAAFEAALKKDPKFVPAASGLAALDLAAGRTDAARKRLQELLKVDPTNVQLHLALADITVRTGGTGPEVARLLGDAVKANPTHVPSRLALVEHLLRTGDAPGAVAAAQEGVAALPDDTQMLGALGSAQLANGAAQQAAATFNQLINKQPTQPMHHVRLADAHMLAKDVAAAKAALNKALEIDPNAWGARRGLAAIALQQGRIDEARAIARELQRTRPKEAAGFQLEGDVERTQRNWPAAVAAYRKAMALAPGTDLAIRLHQAQLGAGQRADADRFAADWQKEHAQDVGFRYYLGDVALGRADYAAAEAHYRAVVEVQPRNALALNNVAWLMAKQGKSGAAKLAEQATQLLPNRPQLMDTLATALAAEGDLKRALDTQRQAIELDRKDPALRLNLARLQLKAGDKAGARTELEALERLGAGFRGQTEVAELLKLAR